MLTAITTASMVIDALAPLFVDLPFESNYITSIVRVSLYVSLIAVALSTLFSLPVAMAVGFRQFRGKSFVTAVINTGMGFPSVVVGLVVLFGLSSGGPLGQNQPDVLLVNLDDLELEGLADQRRPAVIIAWGGGRLISDARGA